MVRGATPYMLRRVIREPEGSRKAKRVSFPLVPPIQKPAFAGFVLI